MTPTDFALSPQVCRDARTLISLTQEELASAASISLSTLSRCERDEAISDYARKQIVAALEGQGVSFVTGTPQVALRPKPLIR